MEQEERRRMNRLLLAWLSEQGSTPDGLSVYDAFMRNNASFGNRDVHEITAIGAAFVWADSPQGNDFWFQLQNEWNREMDEYVHPNDRMAEASFPEFSLSTGNPETDSRPENRAWLDVTAEHIRQTITTDHLDAVRYRMAETPVLAPQPPRDWIIRESSSEPTVTDHWQELEGYTWSVRPSTYTTNNLQEEQMGKPDRSYTLFDIIRLDKSLIVRKVELAVSRLELTEEEARDLIRKTLVKYDVQIGVYDRLVKQIKDISELGYIDTMFAEQEGDEPDWLSPVTDAKDVKRLIFKAHQAKLEQSTNEPAVKLAGLSDGAAERLKFLDAESKQRGLTDQIPMLEESISRYARDAESTHSRYLEEIRLMKKAQSEYMDTLVKIEQFKECSDDDHLIKELETIEKSFGIKAVAVTPGGWIVMITPDYTLKYFEPAAGIDKSVHVGQMCVLFRPYGNVHAEFKVFPFKDNVRKNGHIHCFVASGGQMCFGTGFDECADHQKEGRFTALFSKFSYLMQTYKPDGPYVSFNPFDRNKVKIDTKYISNLMYQRLSNPTGSATADYALFYLLHGEHGLDAMMPDAHRWPYYPSLDGKSEADYTVANRMSATFTVKPTANRRVTVGDTFSNKIQAVHTTDLDFKEELQLAAERYVRSKLDNGGWSYYSYGAQVESGASNLLNDVTDLDIQTSAHEFFGYDENISIDDTGDMRERDLDEVYELEDDPCLLYDFHCYIDTHTRYRIKLWVNFGYEETVTEILRQMYSDMRERPHLLLELMPERFFTRRVEDEQPVEAGEWCKRTDVPLGLNDLRRWLLHECYKRMADKSDVTIDSVMGMIKAEAERTGMNYGAVLTDFLGIRSRGIVINNVLQQHMNRAEALDYYQPTGE